MDAKEEDVPYVLDVEIEMVPPGKPVFARWPGGCFWPAVQLEREAGPRHWQVHWLAKPNAWGKVSKDWTLPYETHRDEIVGMHMQERGRWGDWDAAIIMADKLLSKVAFRWKEEDREIGIDLNLPAQETDRWAVQNGGVTLVSDMACLPRSMGAIDEKVDYSTMPAPSANVETNETLQMVDPKVKVEECSAQQTQPLQQWYVEAKSGSALADFLDAEESSKDVQHTRMGPSTGEEANEFWGCCIKCQAWSVLQSEVTLCGCGEWIRRPSSKQATFDNWIRCDKCSKWRVVSKEMLDRYEMAGSNATWTCQERQDGTRCDFECDWSVLRREMDKSRKSKHLLMKEAGAQSFETFKSKWSEKQYLLHAVLNQTRSRNHQKRGTTSKSPREAVGRSKLKFDEDFWFECESCKVWVLVKSGSRSQTCGCGKVIERPKSVKDSERWIQCELCFKWRRISHRYMDLLLQRGSSVSWHCQKLYQGADCSSIFGDWDSIQSLRKGSQTDNQEQSPLRIKSSLVRKPPATAAKSEYWVRHDFTAGKHFAFIPGLDEVYSSEDLAIGLTIYDGSSGEFVLATREVPDSFYTAIDPFIHAALELFQDGKLPTICDGRAAAGPVDLVAFLQRPCIKEKVERALHRRRERLGLVGKLRCREQEVMHVVHVKPTGRSVYIGDEFDRTVNGSKIMEYNKIWQSNPIQSWSGGKKLQDMPGHKSPSVVTCKLSKLLAEVEHHLHKAAEVLWQLMEKDPNLSSSAEQMLKYYSGCSDEASCRLGQTGWNAYSFNVDFITAAHIDSKNVPGSLSALIVFEVGHPYKGGHYCLPQYHKVLDCRQGIVLFHRSGDPGVGLHANCELHRPCSSSHRVSLILYQTMVKTSASLRQISSPSPLQSESEFSPDLKRQCHGLPHAR